MSSPAIGSGIAPVLSYLFPFSEKDTLSPPSVIGIGGLITNNGSNGIAIAGQLYFKEDTYRVTVACFHGHVNHTLYGLGSGSDGAGFKLPLKQTGEAFFGEALSVSGGNSSWGPSF